jgi:hypothetical protein
LLLNHSIDPSFASCTMFPNLQPTQNLITNYT